MAKNQKSFNTYFQFQKSFVNSIQVHTNLYGYFFNSSINLISENRFRWY